MTPNKHEGHNCPLEERVQSIANDVRDIKAMVAGMYAGFENLVDTVEATHKTVSYEPKDSRYPADEDWDLLDGDEYF